MYIQPNLIITGTKKSLLQKHEVKISLLVSEAGPIELRNTIK